jgi:GNAT superfamily N-acetyltransferase
LGFLSDNCTFSILSGEIISGCEPFDCGHTDLNDFFTNDVQNYSNELLGKSYCFRLDENPKVIVCAFTVSNDSIKANFLPNNRRQKVSKSIPRQKQFRSYPAVLIGRLGVSDSYKKKGIGRELMDFIKSWFIDSNNKTGCRFVVVDSYNEAGPLNYYTRNDFVPLFSTEDQERTYTGVPVGIALKTRLMYFDLIILTTETTE